PELSTVRPVRGAVLRVAVPWFTVWPMPLSVPPLQVHWPVTVTLPEPFSVPPACVRFCTVRGALSVSVPEGAMVRVLLTADETPPEPTMVREPAERLMGLWLCKLFTLSLRSTAWVMVNPAPMVTSSVEPGTRPVLQLAAVSQSLPLPPTQETAA